MQRWTPWAVLEWAWWGETKKLLVMGSQFQSFCCEISLADRCHLPKAEKKYINFKIHLSLQIWKLYSKSHRMAFKKIAKLPKPTYNDQTWRLQSVSSSFSFFVTKKGWRKRWTDLELDTSGRMTRHSTAWLPPSLCELGRAGHDRETQREIMPI